MCNCGKGLAKGNNIPTLDPRRFASVFSPVVSRGTTETIAAAVPNFNATVRPAPRPKTAASQEQLFILDIPSINGGDFLPAQRPGNVVARKASVVLPIPAYGLDGINVGY